MQHADKLKYNIEAKVKLMANVTNIDFILPYIRIFFICDEFCYTNTNICPVVGSHLMLEKYNYSLIVFDGKLGILHA